jgi:hypothetical protein
MLRLRNCLSKTRHRMTPEYIYIQTRRPSRDGSDPDAIEEAWFVVTDGAVQLTEIGALLMIANWPWTVLGIMPTNNKLTEKAALLWGKAGQRSLARSALVAAEAQLTRALAQIEALPTMPAFRAAEGHHGCRALAVDNVDPSRSRQEELWPKQRISHRA